MYEWSEHKRLLNLRKHGIDFANVHRVFSGITHTVEDRSLNYGEQRWMTLGMLDGWLVAVVHVDDGDAVRIISARGANRHEAIFYFSQIEGEH